MAKAIDAANLIDRPAEPQREATTPSHEELTTALDRVALANLRIVSGVGAALYALLAVLQPAALFLTGQPLTAPLFLALSGVDAIGSMTLLGVYLLVRKGFVRASHADALLAGAAAIVLAGATLQMLAVPDALWTVAFILILLASAFFVTSARWFIATLVASVAAWIASITLSPGFQGTALVGVYVAEAGVIAILVFAARYRTIRRLETLRLTDSKRADLLAQAVESRAAAQRELSMAFRERKTIMDTVPDFIYSLDEKSRLVFWNKRVEEVTGCTPEELYGKPCADFVIDTERPLVPGMLRNCEDLGFASQELHLLRKNGPPVLYEVMKAPIFDEDGKLHGYAGVGRDVSEHKAGERRLSAQHAATSVLARGGPEQETLVTVLRTICRALDWSLGALWIVEGDHLRCMGTWRDGGTPSEFETLTRAHKFERGIGLPGRVWASDEPAWIEDVTVDPNFPRAVYARAEGIRGAFAFPIHQAGETIGVMEFFSERIEEPDAHLLRMMGSVGSQVGLFIERKRAEAEIWELNARLQERVDQLQAMNRDLESFSYSVSHDLRAPVRAIRQFSELILEAPDQPPEATHEQVLRIQLAAERMTEIIEDILRLSQVDRTAIHREHIDVSALAREVAAELQAREPSRRVELVVPDGLTANAEPRLVRIVLENLLSNAWKFTRPTPNPRVEVGRHDDGRSRVFFVQDNGSGFEMAKAERLFRPFARLHAQSEFEGTGVGLATVKRVVARHGGRIWAESALGQGATFYFTLEPSAPPGGDARAAEEPSAAPARPHAGGARLA